MLYPYGASLTGLQQSWRDDVIYHLLNEKRLKEVLEQQIHRKTDCDIMKITSDFLNR